MHHFTRANREWEFARLIFNENENKSSLISKHEKKKYCKAKGFSLRVCICKLMSDFHSHLLVQHLRMGESRLRIYRQFVNFFWYTQKCALVFYRFEK